MNTGFVEAPANPAANLGPNLAHAAEDLAGLEPVKTIKSRWPMIIAGALTVALDRPWTTDACLGLELEGAGPVPGQTARPIMIVGNSAR